LVSCRLSGRRVIISSSALYKGRLSDKFIITFVLFSIFFIKPLIAQDNYEIQIYEASLVEKHHTMFELHTNYTAIGSTVPANDMFYSDNLFHATLEVTHGFTKWMEVGAYVFTSIGSDGRTGFAGTHIRPRVACPESMNLPVGLSLSGEFGYQKLGFFGNHWIVEFRPIIDKKAGNFYFSFNSTVDWLADKGPKRGWQFNPCFKASYETGKLIPGLEYYMGLGYFGQFDPFPAQKHQLFMSFDYDISSDWEFNAGIGTGLSSGSDKLILKCIIGRRFGF